MNVTHISLNNWAVSLPASERHAFILSEIKSRVTAPGATFTSGDEFRTDDGQVVAIFVEQLSEFAGALTLEHATFMIEDDPKLVSYKPTVKASDLDVTRYRGYVTRHAVLPSGEFVHQMLTKAFDAPAWINLPHGASVRNVFEKH